MFAGCGEEVTLQYKVLENGTDCEILGASDNTIKKLVIPETIDRYTVTKIGWSAFNGYSELKSVKLPSTLEVIETAFSNCTSLETIEFSEGIKKIHGFNYCSSLKTLEIPASVEDISGFYYCTSLKNIKVDADNNYFTSRDRSGNECNVLVVLKNGEKNPVNWLKLTANEFTIPNDVGVIGGRAFTNCPEMTEIHIPPSVDMISASIFRECPEFTTIYGKAGSKAEDYAIKYGYIFIEE